MFLRNSWYVPGFSHHFKPGEIVARTLLGDPIVLFRTSSGTLAAMEDRCCHRAAPLSRGRVEGDCIRCIGLKFASSGRCVEIPTQSQVPNLSVRTYPVVERDGWVWVWMGEEARADPSVIPEVLHHDNPDFLIGSGEAGYEADHQLIHDNLIDLTHVSFVHENTLGRGSPAWATASPTVTPLERGVRVARWLRDRAAPSFVRADQRCDAWTTIEFLIPGVFLLHARGFATGTADRYPDGPAGPEEPHWTIVTSQAVTPVDDRRTAHFYFAGQPRHQADASLIERQVAALAAAFAEDKVIIEAQQKNIDRAPDRPLLTLQFDRAIAHFRRLVAQMVRQEQAPVTGPVE